MKKYMIMCMAVVALLFASCKNEDISISRLVSFDVNPYEVINDFVNNEVNSGDLEKPGSGYSIRVNLFVYNSRGDLEESRVKYVSNYRETVDVSIELADGNYTVIATTDVVEYNGTVNFEYWNFSGMDRLSELKITDAGYLGSDVKILGIGHKKITVESGKTTCHVDLEPAGALVIAQVWDIAHYSIVDVYDLLTKKSSVNCSFSSDGSYTLNSEEATFYRWYVKRFYPANFSTYGGYGYQFLAYKGNSHFIWEAEINDGSTLEMTGDMALNIETGKTYQFVLDLGEGTYYFGEVNNGKSDAPSLNGKTMSRNSGIADKTHSEQ